MKNGILDLLRTDQYQILNTENDVKIVSNILTKAHRPTHPPTQMHRQFHIFINSMQLLRLELRDKQRGGNDARATTIYTRNEQNLIRRSQ